MLRPLLLLYLCVSAWFVSANDFAGANSYFLYACSVCPSISCLYGLRYDSIIERLYTLGTRQNCGSRCYEHREHEASVPSRYASFSLFGLTISDISRYIVLRIFISIVDENTKGSSAQQVNDLETVAGLFRKWCLALIAHNSSAY